MRPRPSVVDLASVSALWLVSTAAYFAAGVRFDASPFPGYMQFIDGELLRGRLLESIWYSHAHPPGLNLLVGTAYKAFGDSAPVFLAFVFHVLGALLVVMVFALTLRLTRSRAAGYVCAALLVLSPGFVLYENWLMYTFLEAVLLAASAVALYETLDRNSSAWAVTLFAVLAALVLTRGFFHLGWLVLVAAYVAWASSDRARILRAAAVPVLVATLWYAKNFLYFGSFTTSTLFGLSLSNISTLTVPRAELVSLVQQGIVSPLALVSRYEDTAVLFSSENKPRRGIPVLDEHRKSSGEYNYNFEPLIAINEQYTRDALAVIKRYPANYVIGVIIANRLFFSPSSTNEYFTPENRAAAQPFERVFNPLVYGAAAEPGYIPQPHFGFDQPPSLEVNTSLRLLAAWALVLLVGVWRVRRGLRGSATEDRTASVVLGYLLFLMLYVHALGTLAELGENHRYRFVVEPVFIVAAAAVVMDAARGLGDRWLARRR